MTDNALSLTFAALADPTRRAMLGQLAQRTLSVTELAAPHRMSLAAVSKHLRVLERSGLVERGREAQWRPCALKAEPLKEAMEWIEHYREHWEASLDRLEAYLAQLQGKPAPKPSSPKKRPVTSRRKKR